MDIERNCGNCIFMINEDIEGYGFCQKCKKSCNCIDKCENHIVNKNIEFYPVLSISKMIELESLGFDISKASCMWISITDSDYNPISWLAIFRGNKPKTIDELKIYYPLIYKDGNIFYAYTLEDMLSIIDKAGIKYILDNYSITLLGDSLVQFEYAKNPIEAVYESLIYLKENKII